MSRYFIERCTKCGSKRTQDWEEPDKCPNDCDDIEDNYIDDDDYPYYDYDERDEAAEFGGRDYP